jgi:CDGSH-type Zn-finger protein
MARLIRSERDGPYRIDPENFPDGKPMFICACGLSKNLPFCDGGHKACKSEEPGKTYIYREDGTRIEADEA